MHVRIAKKTSSVFNWLRGQKCLNKIKKRRFPAVSSCPLRIPACIWAVIPKVSLSAQAYYSPGDYKKKEIGISRKYSRSIWSLWLLISFLKFNKYRGLWGMPAWRGRITPIDRLTTPLCRDVKSRRWELGSFITAPRWSGSPTFSAWCADPKGITCFGKSFTGWLLLGTLAGSIGATYASINQLARVQENQLSELSLKGSEQNLKQRWRM